MTILRPLLDGLMPDIWAFIKSIVLDTANFSTLATQLPPLMDWVATRLTTPTTADDQYLGFELLFRDPTMMDTLTSALNDDTADIMLKDPCVVNLTEAWKSFNTTPKGTDLIQTLSAGTQVYFTFQGMPGPDVQLFATM